MTRSILIFLVLVSIFRVEAQTSTVSHSVISIGNITDVTSYTDYANAINELSDSLASHHTIVFTGDIIADWKNGSTRYQGLDSLIGLLHDREWRKLVFIPGDRDWDNSGPNGWNNVLELEAHILSLGYGNVIWPLRNGCPGPERVSLDLTLNMIALNTQWWNHEHIKPTPASAACNYADEESILEEIKSEIEDAGYGNLILAGHYPIKSHGEYGGRFPWYKWLVPVPVISSAITAYRQNVGSAVQTSNEEYEPFREEMEEILQEYSSMIYLSGHERNREVLDYEDNVLVGSGGPENARHVARVRETIFASPNPGITVLNFDSDGNVDATQYLYLTNRFVKESTDLILQAPCLHPDPEIVVNERLIPCLQEAYVLTKMIEDYPESVEVAANPKYEQSKFVRFWFGDHYRASWTKPIVAPILDLDTTFGGLVPYAMGGGRQTTSLKFNAEDGSSYVFRSVDKDPSKSLSLDLRTSLISLALKDQTTTQYPYGAIVAASLLDSLDVLHAHPQVFVMPNDPKLGPFQDKYGDLLGTLEEFPRGNRDLERPFADADDIKKTISMFRQLYKDVDNSINVEEYARARVFDILVGDWGKHEDNWKWAGFETDKGTVYRPIPRDRDHVFSKWDGVLPWITDREWAKPSGENFDEKVKDLRSLNWQARHMDRFLASSLDREAWLDAARYVKERMSDVAITNAIAELPEGSDSTDAQEIEMKLISRVERLEAFANKYYDLLAKEVDVVGSINKEQFEVTRQPDGAVLVEMFELDLYGPGDKLYSRLFYPEDTKEIRLFGLLGDDKFLIDGDVKKSILVRVIPGQGSDVVIDSSSVNGLRKKTLVYERGTSGSIEGDSDLKRVRIPNDDAYIYRRTAFAYNTYLPFGFLLYNSGNGLQFAAGVNFTRHSYGKPDFSAKHNLLFRVSTLGNLHFDYAGTVRHVLGKWDLILGAEASKRNNFNYFFGLGNESELNIDSLRSGYYTLRYSNVFAEIGLKREFWKRSNFMVTTQLASHSGESGENNILDDLKDFIPGSDPLRLLRIRWELDLDFRDKPYLPERGMRFTAFGKYAEMLNAEGSYSSTRMNLEWYGTARPVTFSGRVGGWVNHNIPPYYDLQYLGQQTNMRGFRRNRFAGDKGGLYFNGDARIQILDNRKSLIPHKIGLLLFYDVGRVYQSEEVSKVWHQSYGFGVYAVPIRERFVLGLSIGFSVEEKTGLVRFGFGKLF